MSLDPTKVSRISDEKFNELKERLHDEASKSNTFTDTMKNLAADFVSLWLPSLGSKIRSSSTNITINTLAQYVKRLMQANQSEALDLTKQLEAVQLNSQNQSGTHAMQQTTQNKHAAKTIREKMAANQADSALINTMADQVNNNTETLAGRAKNIQDLAGGLASNYEERLNNNNGV